MSEPEPFSTATIELDELRARLASRNLTLVDVLPRASFDAGHLPHAISIPLDELEARAPELLPRRADIVVYCGGFT